MRLTHQCSLVLTTLCLRKGFMSTLILDFQAHGNLGSSMSMPTPVPLARWQEEEEEEEEDELEINSGTSQQQGIGRTC